MTTLPWGGIELTGAAVREIQTQVVVAGAGPVGLMLAGELQRARVPVVVVERLTAPMTESRASQVTTLTAELLHERGFDALLAEAAYEPRAHFGGLSFELSDLASDYAGNWKIPQYRTEAILGKRVEDLGADLYRGYELTEISASDEQVVCLARGPAEDLRIQAAYAVGCDGVSSAVRQCAGITCSGAAATKRLVRADVTGIEIPERRFERNECGFAVANTRDGVTRVMVHVFGEDLTGNTEPPGFPEITRLWKQVTGEDISSGTAIWIDSFDNSWGMADTYRKGNVFVAGDAAHWHMPIGGQALNVGLQDAVNLAWKLAATVHGWGSDHLLDSYHDERRAVAERVLTYVMAQEILQLGDKTNDPLRAVLGEVVGLGQARGHLARVFSGLSDRYGAGESPLVGHRITNIRAAYRALAATGLLAHPEPVLVRFSAAADAAEPLVLPGGQPVRVVRVPPDGDGSAGATAILVRPDGYIAWTGNDKSVPDLTPELLFGARREVR